MKVKTMIEMLRRFPQEAEVRINSNVFNSKDDVILIADCMDVFYTSVGGNLNVYPICAPDSKLPWLNLD